MTASSAKPFPVAARAGAAPRQGSIGAAVSALVVIALIATWACDVLPIENSVTSMGPDDKLLITAVKGQAYYTARAISLACMLGAGFLSVLRGRLRLVSIGVRAAFCVLLAVATIWAALAYTPDEIFSSQISSVTGPFVWFGLLLTLAGVEKPVWKYIDPVIRTLAYVSSALAIQALFSLKYGAYLYFSKYVLYAILLLWLGGWTFLTATRLRGWSLMVRTIPYIVGVLMAICSQSRSWIIQFLLVGVAFIWLRCREQGSATSGIRALVIGVVLAVAVWGAVYVTTPETMDGSIHGLVNRAGDDTRSGQYRAFFRVVPPADLLLGRGPKGTWYWRGMGEYQFFDNGYLWMLFIGGVPTLLSYLTIVIWPAVRASRLNPLGDDAVAVVMLSCWGLALAGLSTYTLPSLGLSNFLIALWAGRCHRFLAEQDGRALAAVPRDFAFPAAGESANRRRNRDLETMYTSRIDFNAPGPQGIAE